METDEGGRLLLYENGMRYGQLVDLVASLQREFSDQVVVPADPKWLLETAGKSIDREARRRLERPGFAIRRPIVLIPHRWQVEYVYLVLGWLGATISKQMVERAINAAADAVVQWVKSRRTPRRDHPTRTMVYILGPDGRVLKEVRVDVPQESERSESH
jgi:hypothetical protein